MPHLGKGGKHGDSGSFTLNRNNANGGLLSGQQDPAKKNITLSNSPNKTDSIKNKRVFIENTVDSILHSKQTKTGSFMGKPVGAMSGTGTTDVLPKVHSVSPRGNLGNSIVGLPNIIVGQG